MSFPRSRRDLLAAAAFGLLAAVTAVPFGATYAAHLTRFALVGMDVEVTDASLAESLRVDLRFTNPGRVPATLFMAQLRGVADGRLFTDITASQTEKVTVSPGETVTVRVSVGVREGYREALRRALDAGELRVSGTLGFRVADSSVQTEFVATEVGG